MAVQRLMAVGRKVVPLPVKERVARWRGTAAPELPLLGDVGVVLDDYIWLSDDRIDTVVPIENYFSAYFPDVDTSTSAILEVADAAGAPVARTTVDVPHLAAPMVRLSQLLADAGRSSTHLGTVRWHLAVPAPVLDALGDDRSRLLFWDRSYIAFVSPNGHAAFVHGVDKVEVAALDGARTPWPTDRRPDYRSLPELPLAFDGYDEIDVLVQNRSARPRRITVAVDDRAGATRSWDQDLAAHGVARVRVHVDDLAGLDRTQPLRLRAEHLPTRYGRPVVLTWFPSGAFSLLHC